MVVEDAVRPKVMRYRCAWTVLGIGKAAHEAYCVSGQWEYPGWRDPLHVGEC